jgi:PPOX class probable FMN-dependent enzyme
MMAIITKFITITVAEIQQQPWAEACWYFPNTREQFRFAGSLILVSDDNSHPTLKPARITSWQELSDAGRLQFAWPDPGKRRVEEKAAFTPPPPNPNQPLPNFCLLLLEPVQVDHLELRGEPQNRWLYLRDDNHTWSSQEINP